MTPRAIIFDLDDTLADRPASFREYAKRLHADFVDALHPCTPAELHEALVSADDFGTAKQAQSLARSPLWRMTPDAQTLFEHWNAHFGEAATPFAGAIELLKAFRESGVKLGLVTNGHSAMQRSKISALGIEALLDAIIVSGEVGLQKPDGAIFALALSRLGCLAEEAWFVGDRPDHDIQGALDAGLQAFWVKTGPFFAEKNVPGTHLGSLPELLQHLR